MSDKPDAVKNINASKIGEGLKACPFCGDTAVFGKVGHEPEDGGNAGGEFVMCLPCGCCTDLMFPTMGDVKPLLAEKWNRRIGPPVAADRQTGAAELPDSALREWDLRAQGFVDAIDWLRRYATSQRGYRGNAFAEAIAQATFDMEASRGRLEYQAALLVT